VWAAAVDTGAHGDNLTHHGEGWWPDPLLAVGSAMAEANVTSSLWFTVYAPADTPAGQYAGTVSLHENRVGPQPSLHIELLLSVRVYGFSLPQTPALKTAFNLDRGRIADKYGANAQQSTLMAYARWLLTNFSVNPGAIYEPPATYSVAEITELAALGMNALTLFPSGHSAAQANKIAGNVSSLVSALSRRNLSAQLQLNFYGFDESNDLRGLTSTFGVLKQRFPTISSLTTAHFEHIEPDAIRNLHVDIPCPIMDAAAALMPNISRCVHAGIQVWTYVSPEPYGEWLNWRIDNELFEPRLIFWQTSMMLLSGFLYEGLNAWGQNWTLIDEIALTSPFLDRRIWCLNTDRPRGVGVKMLIYPGKAAPIPSQRLAAIRDGIEDFGYFDLLRKTDVDTAVLSAIFANVTDPRDLSQHISGTAKELGWLMERRDEVARLIEARQMNPVQLVRSHKTDDVVSASGEWMEPYSNNVIGTVNVATVDDIISRRYHRQRFATVDVAGGNVLAWVETKRMNATEMSTQLEVIKTQWSPFVSTVSATVYTLLPDPHSVVVVGQWPSTIGSSDPNGEWFSTELLRAGFRTTPLVQLAGNGESVSVMRQLFANKTARAAVVAHLVQKCDAFGWSGLCLDIEASAELMTAADGVGYAQFLTELSDAIHASDPQRTVCATIAGWGTAHPADDYSQLYQFGLLNKTSVDRLIQMTSYTSYNLDFLRATVGAAIYIDSGRVGCVDGIPCGRHFPNKRLGAGLCTDTVPQCTVLSLDDLKMRLGVLKSLAISHVDLWLGWNSSLGAPQGIPGFWVPLLKDFVGIVPLKTDDVAAKPEQTAQKLLRQLHDRLAPRLINRPGCIVDAVATASCFGSNASDATEIVQAAISSGASTILIDDIGRPWIVRPLFVTQNDTTIVFAPNVILLAKRDEFHGYNDALLSFRGVRNITIVGNNATLQMRRADYAVPSWGTCPDCRPYKKSEWRAGIMIAESDDLRISGLNIIESGGDGFYIHCAPGCRNLHITDCVADRNYRQGMSVCGAVNLLVERVTFSRTNGTAPQAGVDLEPDHPRQLLSNVTFRDCRSFGNTGCGFQAYLNALNASSEPISIVLSNFSVSSKDFGIALMAMDKVRGTIDVSDSHIVDTVKTGIAVFDKTVRESIVRIRRCRLERTGTRGAGFFPLAVSAQRWATLRHFAVGNVTFDDCDVYDDVDRRFLQAWNPGLPDRAITATRMRVHNPYGCKSDPNLTVRCIKSDDSKTDFSGHLDNIAVPVGTACGKPRWPAEALALTANAGVRDTVERTTVKLKIDDTSGNSNRSFSINGTRLRYMSFYGYNASVQAGWCNLGISGSVSALVHGHATSGGTLRGLVELKGRKIFNEEKKGIEGLTSNWTAAWKSLLAEMTPGLRSGALAGVFLGDEMALWGCKVKYQAAVASRVREDLERLGVRRPIVYTNAAPQSVSSAHYSLGIPGNLTHFSVDMYGRVDATRAFYAKHIFPKLSGGLWGETSVFVVPGVFAAKKAIAKDEALNLEHLQDYISWAKEEHRISGINPWHLGDDCKPGGSCPGSSMALGAFGCCMPNLDAALKKVGMQIVSGGQERAPYKADDTGPASSSGLWDPSGSSTAAAAWPSALASLRSPPAIVVAADAPAAERAAAQLLANWCAKLHTRTATALPLPILTPEAAKGKLSPSHSNTALYISLVILYKKIYMGASE
jgi:hypothetical protein